MQTGSKHTIVQATSRQRARVHVVCVQYEYHERDLQALSVRIERVVQERTRVRSAV